jgi:DNA-binding NarL/FixJ family response regulator
MSKGCRVLVADSAPTRLGVRMALDGVAQVCGEAGDLEGAVREARRSQPDVCLVGQLLPGGGIATVHRLSQVVPDAAVVLLACTDDVGDLLAALSAGALGYVRADVGAVQLRRVVRAVHAREAAVPRSMVRDLVDALRAPGRAAEEGLTRRQAEIRQASHLNARAEGRRQRPRRAHLRRPRAPGEPALSLAGLAGLLAS